VARDTDTAQAKRENIAISAANQSCELLGKAVGGRPRHLPCPLAPDFARVRAGTRRVAAPSRPIPKFSVGRGEAFNSPAEGDNRIGRLICPGAGKESEANRLRLNYYCRLHILPDASGILKINSRTVTKFSPFISSGYRRLNVGQISPRSVSHRNVKSGDRMGAQGP
jgi:hypothetical protein